MEDAGRGARHCCSRPARPLDGDVALSCGLRGARRRRLPASRVPPESPDEIGGAAVSRGLVHRGVREMRCSQEALTRRNADCGTVAGFYKSPSPRTARLPTPRRAWPGSPPGLLSTEPPGREGGSPEGLREWSLQAVVSQGGLPVAGPLGSQLSSPASGPEKSHRVLVP